MTSSGSQLVFDANTGTPTSPTFTVDNQRIALVQVIGGAGSPVGRKLYVYGSLGTPGNANNAINPLVASSPTNPYSGLMVRDMNDLNAIPGTDGISVTANSVGLYEINVNAVRDVHFVLAGSGVPVTVVFRGYYVA